MAHAACNEGKSADVVGESGTISYQAAAMNREEALQTAARFKKALLDEKIPFEEVIVFGSAARDTMHEQSDIDIAVVGRSYKGNRMDEQHALSRIRRGISYKIQPIWFYPEHLEDKYSTLAMEIKKDGIPV